MIKDLKHLALALVAVFAMSAIAASAAQAEEDADFWADETAVTIDTAADSEHQTYVSKEAGTLRCTVVTGHAIYEGESPEQTATGVGYDNCAATNFGITFPVTVTPETNCHFTFTAGTFTNSGGDDEAGQSHGSVHICGMTIDVFNKPHPGGTMRCQIHVLPQTIDGVTFTNVTTEGVMAVTIEYEKVTTAETITDFNTLGCNNHLEATLEYTGSIWAKATNEDEEYVDTTVTGTP